MIFLAPIHPLRLLGHPPTSPLPRRRRGGGGADGDDTKPCGASTDIGTERIYVTCNSRKGWERLFLPRRKRWGGGISVCVSPERRWMDFFHLNAAWRKFKPSTEILPLCPSLSVCPSAPLSGPAPCPPTTVSLCYISVAFVGFLMTASEGSRVTFWGICGRNKRKRRRTQSCAELQFGSQVTAEG